MNRELIDEIEVLRGALRLAAITIRHLKDGQKVGTAAVLAQIARVNFEARELVMACKDGDEAVRPSA